MSNADRSADELFDNEQKADLGEVAVGAVVDTLGDVGPAVAQIEDTLTYVAHLCDRYGLTPAEMFKDALRRYRQDLEGHHARDGGAPVRRIADGRVDSIEQAS